MTPPTVFPELMWQAYAFLVILTHVAFSAINHSAVMCKCASTSLAYPPSLLEQNSRPEPLRIATAVMRSRIRLKPVSSKRILNWEIWGSHSGGFEEFCFIGYNACSPLKVNRCFGVIYRLHFSVEEQVKQEASVKQVANNIKLLSN
jgi:hypothetical protein